MAGVPDPGAWLLLGVPGAPGGGTGNVVPIVGTTTMGSSGGTGSALVMAQVSVTGARLKRASRPWHPAPTVRARHRTPGI
jgi:hypothetical protein